MVGDPFGATTHSDLLLRAKEKGVKTKAIHNASIMNAVGCVGLQVRTVMPRIFGFTIKMDKVTKITSLLGQKPRTVNL